MWAMTRMIEGSKYYPPLKQGFHLASAKGGFQTGSIVRVNKKLFHGRKVASTGMALSDLTRNGFSSYSYANGQL